MVDKQYYVYILANKSGSTLYTGITNNLEKRMWEHTHKIIEGFTSRYNITKLVYFEYFDQPMDAIRREKQIKGLTRIKKMSLIKKANSLFNDLSKNL